MMALRAAAREVYRVYGEDEFFAEDELFADANRASERLPAGGSSIAARRLRRLAGATALLAALGAVGWLVVLASELSAAGSGRTLGRRLAAAASRTSVGAQVWRARAASERPRSHGKRPQRVGRASDVSPARNTPRHHDASRDDDVPRAAAARPAASVGSGPGRELAEVPAPASVARPAASASVGSRRSGRSEFGFER